MENNTDKLIDILIGNLRTFLETEVIVIIAMGILAIASYMGDNNIPIDIVIYFIVVTIINILLCAISLYQDMKKLKDDKK